MLKSILKSSRSTLFDLRVRKMVANLIWSVDTFDQFEKAFNEQIKQVQGYGELFKISYYVKTINDKAQVWRVNTTGGRDYLLFDIVTLTNYRLFQNGTK